MKALQEHGIGLIDMVVVNLYKFEDTVAKEGCTLEQAIENIDIGGPTILRAGAKNYKFVSVVTDPDDYDMVLDRMEKAGGSLDEAFNFYLALKAFQLTARYDGAISNHLGTVEYCSGIKKPFPDTFTFQVAKAQDLRYGENPHQQAAFYKEPDTEISGLANARQLQGKELSYNNIMDGDAAWRMVSDFSEPAAIIVKHANPCGAATADEICDAYLKALQTDPVSAFGGIVVLNRTMDGRTAAEVSKLFLEILIAPAFDNEAKKILAQKPNLRVLEIPPTCNKRAAGYDFRRVAGGLLIQDWDNIGFDVEKTIVVTKRRPTGKELRALDFAWRIVKYVKSNAIVYTAADQLVGVGAGQMSRVDSVKIARAKAILPTQDCVMASDAMFPFRDGIDEAAKAGITAVIQTGGSNNDADVIKAADEHDLAMLFTGTRHFKH